MLYYNSILHSSSQEWVTFVHGAGGSSNIWYKQIKSFSKSYNVLLLDLRGHGGSMKGKEKQDYTFSSIAKDVLQLLDHLKIKHTHFVGISLGTIVIRQIAEEAPDRVKSMIMGGAILKMNARSKFLMKFGDLFKNILPYLMLYRLFAWIIMPKKNHQASRNLFIKEAKKLYQKEFVKWFALTKGINSLLFQFRQRECNIPTLYIMGSQDYLFLPPVLEVVKQHQLYSNLITIHNCGHVVNVEQAGQFNQISLEFIRQNNL